MEGISTEALRVLAEGLADPLNWLPVAGDGDLVWAGASHPCVLAREILSLPAIRVGDELVRACREQYEALRAERDALLERVREYESGVGFEVLDYDQQVPVEVASLRRQVRALVEENGWLRRQARKARME